MYLRVVVFVVLVHDQNPLSVKNVCTYACALILMQTFNAKANLFLRVTAGFLKSVSWKSSRKVSDRDENVHSTQVKQANWYLVFLQLITCEAMKC